MERPVGVVVDALWMRSGCSERSRRVDVHVIAATNQPLCRMVDDGTFRADLYFRLNGFHLRVPALDDRPEDIPVLASHFARKTTAKLGRRTSPAIHADTMQSLLCRTWPGNVRQLIRWVERLVADAITSNQATIGPEDIARVAATEDGTRGRPRLLKVPCARSR